MKIFYTSGFEGRVYKCCGEIGKVGSSQIHIGLYPEIIDELNRLQSENDQLRRNLRDEELLSKFWSEAYKKLKSENKKLRESVDIGNIFYRSYYQIEEAYKQTEGKIKEALENKQNVERELKDLEVENKRLRACIEEMNKSPKDERSEKNSDIGTSISNMEIHMREIKKAIVTESKRARSQRWGPDYRGAN